MSNTVRTPSRKQLPMSSTRKTALVAGAFYIITFVSIPTLGLYGPVKSAGYVLGSGPDSGALLGAFLEVIVALAGIGTAFTLFPVVRRQNEAMALGFVASRTLEAAMIFTGVASILSLVSLRQAGVQGGDEATLVTLAGTMVTHYNWAFTLGQSLMPGLNAVLLGTLLYRSGLVPRILPLIGLIGAPLHLTAVVLTMFGAIDRIGTVAMIAVVPVAVWELSLGIYLVVKGFKRCPITDSMATAEAAPAYRGVLA